VIPRAARLVALPLITGLGLLASVARADDAPAPAPVDPHEVPEFAAPVKKEPKVSTLSIMGGLRAGFTLPAGKMAAEAVGPAFDFAGELGMRLVRYLYAGVRFGGTLFSSPKSNPKSISSLLFGVEVGYLTNPDGFGLFPTLGAGYRRVSVADALGTSIANSGVDLLVGLGLHFKLGKEVRLIPRVDFAAGSAGDFAHYLFTIGLSAYYNYDFK
jgi:hypothetical protein